MAKSSYPKIFPKTTTEFSKLRKIPHPGTMKFSGKTYRSYTRTPFLEHEADREAKSLRMDGYLARVVKLGKDNYAIYFRKK